MSYVDFSLIRSSKLKSDSATTEKHRTMQNPETEPHEDDLSWSEANDKISEIFDIFHTYYPSLSYGQKIVFSFQCLRMNGAETQ